MIQHQMTPCRWCGLIHGPKCPSVKAIEYYPDGTVKRIEFYSPNDYGTVMAIGPGMSVTMGDVRS